VLEHGDENGTEKFWISKKTREVLKEEDHGKSGGTGSNISWGFRRSRMYIFKL
jgi:hypothetical protein